MPEKEDFISRLQSICKTSASFVAAKMGLGIIEHPTEIVIAQQQLNPKLTIVQATQSRYSEKGARGFYAGFPSNMAHMAIKSAYRAPMLCQFPEFCKSKLPETYYERYPYLPIMLTIPILSALDTTITTPLSRIKNLQITGQINQGFWGTLKKTPVKELFRGYEAVGIQQVSGWTSFLVLDEASKYFLRKYHPDKPISNYEILASSACIGVALAIIDAPFGNLVLQSQKSTPAAEKRSLAILNQIIKQEGGTAVFAGWRGKVFQSVLNTCLVSVFREWVTNHEPPPSNGPKLR